MSRNCGCSDNVEYTLQIGLHGTRWLEAMLIIKKEICCAKYLLPRTLTCAGNSSNVVKECINLPVNTGLVNHCKCKTIQTLTVCLLPI